MPRRKRLPATPMLESERLILRPLRFDDGPVLQRRFPRWEVVQYLNDKVPWPYPADGGQTHANLVVERTRKRQSFTWAITLKAEGDELIGLMSLRPDDGTSREMRGFWLDPDYWGQGLMFEAAELVTEYAFVDLDWSYLWLDNAEANTGSHRIKEKQGAVIVDRVPGRWVSGEGMKVVWLLTRNAWLARRAGETRAGLPATPVLETERLVLRPICLEDGPVLQRRFPRWKVVQYLNDKAPWPYPADGGQTFANLVVERMRRRISFTWAITLKESDELIGVIDLLPDDGESRGMRGFWLDPDYWGRGIMFEAAERVTEYAFVDLAWPYLWLQNAEPNTGSHRIKEKQGALLVDRVPGRWVGGEGMKVVWLLTRNAWFARRAAETRAGLPETPVLETERLTLRPMRLDDGPVMQRRFPQWEIVRYLNAANIPWPFPEDSAINNAAETVAEMERREKLQWAITLKGGDDELIGRMTLWPDDGTSRDMRGFWLDPEFWGRGLMTEAAERVTGYAFRELGWPHLWLRSGAENVGSHRVKEQQGARFMDSVPADFVSGPGTSTVWLLTRNDWLRGRTS
jgi:ribosomal-protein-alanine N-acetyltransferase